MLILSQEGFGINICVDWYQRQQLLKSQRIFVFHLIGQQDGAYLRLWLVGGKAECSKLLSQSDHKLLLKAICSIQETAPDLVMGVNFIRKRHW